LLGLPVKTTIGEPFIELSAVNSTNIYAMSQLQANLAEHGAAFFAHHQFDGKGQRGKKWQASPSKNLILSVIINIKPLASSPIFGLHCFSALACIDLLKPIIPDELYIKWPNDIYWRDRKAGGILIETIVREGIPQFAVVGIGLNINEDSFPEITKKAVSIKQITGKEYEPVELAKKLCVFLNDRYTSLVVDNMHQQLEAFNSYLFKRNEMVKLKKNNAIANYLIKEVNTRGELVVEAGITHHFQFGEVEWLTY
jgi:BirA family transcriptional regulator, biotin operon repressor / biotin---[acetyl-CoA-carboxylase] ligase